MIFYDKKLHLSTRPEIQRPTHQFSQSPKIPKKNHKTPGGIGQVRVEGHFEIPKIVNYETP